MTGTEQAILQELLGLEQSVRSMASGKSKPNLLPVFDRLDELTRQLPVGTNPTLLHYLHKRSYEKARLWLQGRDAQNAMGSCQHT